MFYAILRVTIHVDLHDFRGTDNIAIHIVWLAVNERNEDLSPIRSDLRHRSLC